MKVEKLNIKPVEGILIGIVPLENDEGMEVFIINQNTFDLENVLISSKGYGLIDGEEKKTSALRQHIDKVDLNSAHQIEILTPDLVKLNNEFWVSYYIGKQIYDKKFVFLAASFSEDNYTNIPFMDDKGLLHK